MSEEHNDFPMDAAIIGVVLVFAVIGHWRYLNDIEEVKRGAVETCTQQRKQFEACRIFIRKRHPRCIERHWHWSQHFMAGGEHKPGGALDRDGYRQCLLKEAWMDDSSNARR